MWDSDYIFYIRTSFIRTTRLELVKKWEQIKYILRLEKSKTTNWNSNDLNLF